MFELQKSWTYGVNILVVVLFALLFFRGFKRGFFRQIISIAGTLLSLYISYILCPVFGKYLPLWPRTLTPMQTTPLAGVVYDFTNKGFWFLLFLLITRFAFIAIDQLLKGVGKIPLLKQISEILGGVVGLAEGAVWSLIICFIITLPVFKGGSYLIEHTFLAPIRDVTNDVLTGYVDPLLASEHVSDIVSDTQSLSKDGQKQAEDWLIEHGYIEEEEN